MTSLRECSPKNISKTFERLLSHCSPGRKHTNTYAVDVFISFPALACKRTRIVFTYHALVWTLVYTTFIDIDFTLWSIKSGFCRYIHLLCHIFLLRLYYSYRVWHNPYHSASCRILGRKKNKLVQSDTKFKSTKSPP